MIIGISGKIGSGKDTVGKIIQELTMNSYHQSPWQIKKFAGKLKQIVSLLTGIPVKDLEKQEVKDRVLGEEWSKEITYLGHLVYGNKTFTESMTAREMLQRIGTDAMRDVIHPNVWVNALFADYTIPAIFKGKLIECDRCDGCGWYEGGPTLKTTCEHCGGTGAVKDDRLLHSRWLVTDVRFPNEAQAIKERGGLLVRINRGTPADNQHISETALDDYEGFDIVIDNNGTLDELKEKVKEILKHEKIKTISGV